MQRESDKAFLPLLESAIDEEIGVFIRAENRKNLEAILFRLRKELEPTFDEIAIFTPVIDGRDDIIFLAKRTVELPE